MQALLEEFRKLPDYRKNRVGYTHPGEILFLSLLAILSGAQGYEDIALSWLSPKAPHFQFQNPWKPLK